MRCPHDFIEVFDIMVGDSVSTGKTHYIVPNHRIAVKPVMKQSYSLQFCIYRNQKYPVSKIIIIGNDIMKDLEV